ncbi:probable WRKY transcription factor 27 [Humulus lupulus]|uniref:probable WRKY transcription factor 27 n=1 Tax=Humulus lupulus TaxID=3486 RepID=UPI002B40593D|nr:probable WRKY transcription factor 27 [Humulus lupulus]
MEDWDLLAVVRSGGNSNNICYESPNMATNNTMNYTHQTTSFFVGNPLSGQENDDDNHGDHDNHLSLFHSFPHLFETTTPFDELEELYKPFYPVDLKPPIMNSHLPPSDLPTVQPKQEPPQKNLTMVQTAKQPAPPKYKKRKNQQKRVVKEVREDGLYSDKWAWRKYGQKPIKGSPYPRSYYRCSSSKGCLARKQVERSPSDPEIFIVTYTSDHSHAHPTRRNSLAGSTRSKFPVGTISNNNNLNTPLEDNKSLLDCTDSDKQKIIMSSDNSTTVNTSVHREEEEDVMFGDNNNEYLFPSLEDLEKGLEELDDEVQSANTTGSNPKSDQIFDYNGGFDLDYEFSDHDHNFMDAWFSDQYSTTVTGAC